MPATRITVALNAKQSQKAPLLIPTATLKDPSLGGSCRDLVIKTAQSKLRLKKASRIFVAGDGRELLEHSDWSVLQDDTVLLVSAGEDYVGLRKDAPFKNSSLNPDCAISILAKQAPVDPLSITQVETTARTLPGLIYACAQPDLHPGTKFPIGAVFVSKEWIHPPLIGGDIGCGMAWYRTMLSRSQVDGDKGKKVAEKLRGLEGSWRTQLDREEWLSDGQDSYSAGKEWDSALGSIGAGNHFAEIQVVESALGGLRENEVVLLVHSGSRGYGGDILKRYSGASKTSLHEDDPLAKEYLTEHNRACGWAKANRDLIALRFLSCLEPGEGVWALGRNDLDVESQFSVAEVRRKLLERKVVDIWHNNVAKIEWPPRNADKTITEQAANLSIDDGTRKKYAYVHRKGAAPTYDPISHKPLELLPLPGSRGTPTIILRPQFSEKTSWGLKNALSLAHGAGRSMSRAKALSSMSQKYQNIESLLQPSSKDVQHKEGADGAGVHGGTWVICDEKQLVWEEAPEAYKDVYKVAADLVSNDVAEVLGWCRARVSYKVRDELR